MFLSLLNHKHSSHNLFKFKKLHHRDEGHSHTDRLHGQFDQLIQDLSHRVFEFKKDEKVCDDTPVVMQDTEEKPEDDSTSGQKLSVDAMLLAVDGEMISDTPNSVPVEEEVNAPTEDILMVMRETESVSVEAVTFVSENSESEIVSAADVAQSIDVPTPEVLIAAPATPTVDLPADQELDVSVMVDMSSEFILTSEEISNEQVVTLDTVADGVAEPTLELTTGEVVTDTGITAELPTAEVNVLEEALPVELAPIEVPQIAEETSGMLPDVTIQTLTPEAPTEVPQIAEESSDMLPELTLQSVTAEAPVEVLQIAEETSDMLPEVTVDDDVILQNVASSGEDDEIVMEENAEPKSENCFEISVKDHNFNWNFNLNGDHKSWGNWSNDNGDCGSLGDFVGNMIDNLFKSWGGDHHTTDAELCQ